MMNEGDNFDIEDILAQSAHEVDDNQSELLDALQDMPSRDAAKSSGSKSLIKSKEVDDVESILNSAVQDSYERADNIESILNSSVQESHNNKGSVESILKSVVDESYGGTNNIDSILNSAAQETNNSVDLILGDAAHEAFGNTNNIDSILNDAAQESYGDTNNIDNILNSAAEEYHNENLDDHDVLDILNDSADDVLGSSVPPTTSSKVYIEEDTRRTQVFLIRTSSYLVDFLVVLS